MTTRHDGDHEKWAELAAGYALDALEPDEQVAFEVHLASCADCRHGLDEHDFVAAQLGALAADADDTAPSWAEMRTGIVGAAPAAATDLDVARQRRRARVSWPMDARILTAAAVTAVLAAAGIVLAVRGPMHSSKPGTSAIKACAASLSCHVVRMPGAGVEKAAVLIRDGSARVVPTALPSAPSDRVYVLWQMRPDGTPTPLAVLPDVVDGQPTAAHPLTVPYADTSQFAISLEPNDVVPTQPTDVIATSSPSPG